MSFIVIPIGLIAFVILAVKHIAFEKPAAQRDALEANRRRQEGHARELERMESMTEEEKAALRKAKRRARRS